MPTTIELPDCYGWVVASGVILPFVSSILLGGSVMTARKKFEVHYPNLYATPGHHKNADDFNRVQRGHQSMFETMHSVSLMTLVGGLVHPCIATAANVSFCLGSYLFMVGYSDTNLDVSKARYQRGGLLKPIGYLAALATAAISCYKML